MAEIFNLRQKRKQAARTAARKTAEANAARFGQTKHTRALTKARTEQAERHLDGHRRSPPDTPED